MMKTVGPAVFGKTERTVGLEGDGYPITEELVRHCHEKSAVTDRFILKLLNHFLTLDLVVLIDKHYRCDWMVPAVEKRLREELSKVDVEINQEKTKMADLEEGETFSFLGFDFCKRKSWHGRKVVLYTPRGKAKAALKLKIREIFKQNKSRPIKGVIEQINPILRGWVNYFRIGNSTKCFKELRYWVEKKVRRHLMKSRQRQGFGWKRWNSEWIYRNLWLFNNYKVQYFQEAKVSPAQ